MRLGIKQTVILNIAVLGLAISQIGCASTSMQRSKQTRTTMAAVEVDYRKASAQVEITGTSMKSLVKTGQVDVKKTFDKFSAHVDKMEDLKDRLFEHADQMRVQQRAYFNEWRMEGEKYENPRIQALSEQRRADLQATFSRVARASVGVKRAFKSYISDIQQIEKYLANDLTAKGVEAITPTVWKAVHDGEDLSNEIQPVLIALEDARTEMAQSGN